MTVRAGTKSANAIAVMVSMADKPMDLVVPKIAEATGLDLDKAKHYYVLFVRKALAPGVIPGKAPTAPKALKIAKAKAVKRMVAETIAKASIPMKTPEEIDRIKAANMERMRLVMSKVKQTVKVEDPEYTENDGFTAPAFLTKDEVHYLV